MLILTYLVHWDFPLVKLRITSIPARSQLTSPRFMK
jgi:hypothetical protein